MDSTSFLMKLLTEWNLILLIIGGCSVLAAAIFIERLVALRRSEVDTNRLLVALRNSIQDGNVVDALRICDETGGTVASIVKAGLAKHDAPREKIEHAMEISGLIEVARLEKNAKVLSIIAHIAPLIGLLGTVLGFIQAFGQMRSTGLMDISATHIGSAMEYALETTAAGLAVAIPTVIGYNYIVSRIEAFLLEIQTTSSEIVELLMGRQEQLESIR